MVLGARFQLGGNRIYMLQTVTLGLPRHSNVTHG